MTRSRRLDDDAIKSRLDRANNLIALHEAQQKLRVHSARRKRRKQLLENSEYWELVGGGYAGVIDRLSGPDKDIIYAISTANDRRYGANWPFWRTWQEHARIRAASRFIYTVSPLARGTISAFRSYVVGEGMQGKSVALRDDTPPGLVEATQDVLDGFDHLNRFRSMQREFFDCSRHDGDAIWRWFPRDDGELLVRPVLPEWVVEPPGYTLDEASFGIFTDPDDLCDRRGLWVSYDGSASNGEYVSFSQAAHHKINVPSVVKRGLPDFAFDTQAMFRTASKLLTGLGEGAAIQASIALIRQHQNAGQAGVEDFLAANEDYTATRPMSGVSESVRRFESGTIIDIDAGQEYVAPPFASNVGGHVEVVQALLRGVAVQWNAPEWIVSADSSNSNFASALVADSPFTKRCKTEQDEYGDIFRRVYLAALQHHCNRRGGIRAGGKKYPWEAVKELIDVSVVPPTVETRNKVEESQLNRTYIELGIKSRQTAAQELGLDWEVEERNNEEFEKKHGEQGVKVDQRTAEGGDDAAAADVGEGPDDGGGGGGDTRPPGGGAPGAADDFSDLDDLLAGLEGGGPGLAESSALTESDVHRFASTQFDIPEPSRERTLTRLASPVPESCAPNRVGKGYHDTESGHPCTPGLPPASRGDAGEHVKATPIGRIREPGQSVRDALAKSAGGLKAGIAAAKARLGGSQFAAMSPKSQGKAARLFALAKAVEHRVMIGFSKGKEMAAQVAAERGAPDLEADRVGKVVGVVDQILTWTTTFPVVTAATGNPMAGKVASFLPVASLAYLTYSTARNPLATLRAAKKVFGGKAKTHETESPRGVHPDQVEDLLHLFAAAEDPDREMANVLVALDASGGDLDAAIQAVHDADASRLTEAGYTGRTTDKRGRVRCYQSGKPVACHKDTGSGGDTHAASDATVATAHDHVERLLGSPAAATHEDIAKAVNKLLLLTKPEIAALKKKYGLVAGGAKEAAARKIAEAAAKVVGIRQRFDREARKAGVSPAELHEHAGRSRAIASGYAKDVRRMLAGARHLYRELNDGKQLSRNHKAFRDGDYTQLDKFDLVARTIAGRYPEMLGDPDDDGARQRLYDFLAAGSPPLPSREDTYRESLDSLVRKKEDGASGGDDVPFEFGDLLGKGDDAADAEPKGPGPLDAETAAEPSSPDETVAPPSAKQDKAKEKLNRMAAAAAERQEKWLAQEADAPTLTRDEYIEKYGNPKESRQYGTEHERLVRDAVSRGESVPEKVLLDYPDLHKSVENAKASKATLSDYLASKGSSPEVIAKVLSARQSARGFRTDPATGSNVQLPPGVEGNYRRHHDAVADALAAGKSVPPEVLKDYPDLAAAHAEKTRFTGTDALGREWVDGKLVAKAEESPTPDVAPTTPPEKNQELPVDNRLPSGNIPSSGGNDSRTGGKAMDVKVEKVKWGRFDADYLAIKVPRKGLIGDRLSRVAPGLVIYDQQNSQFLVPAAYEPHVSEVLAAVGAEEPKASIPAATGVPATVPAGGGLKVSRRDAAASIADALDAAGYRASVWTPREGGSAVRVYLKDGRGRPLGYLDVTREGRVEPHLERQKGTVMAAVPELDIEPRLDPTPASRATTPPRATAQTPPSSPPWDGESTEVIRGLMDRAVADGVTRDQIKQAMDAYPAMRQESWWQHNARSDPARAVRHRLELLDRQEFERRAAAWTDAELLAVVRDLRSGKPVDHEKAAEAVHRGFASASEAMNTDF